MSLLLPGIVIMAEAPTVSAAPSIGRVTVSGTKILVDGAVPTEKFFGVDDTTALQFAIMAYINGETNVAGWSSVFPGPDTSTRRTVDPHDTADNFWHQYFALMQYYDCNLVRIGCGDAWGTELQYNAWLNHHDAYISLLKTMCRQAEAHGVWVTLVLAGSQEYPTFQYKGSGTVFDPSSSAFSRWAAYCRDVMTALDGENAICWYDLYNEPDHNFVAQSYWKGDKAKFNTWARAAVAATNGVSSHPRTMGVAALGTLFGWNKADFDLAVGTIGVEILHVHYYGSNYDSYNFAAPEDWARQNGKPLFWGELGWNGQYPLTRYTFAENAIWNAGGQAIASMVLTGTSGYPYYGGSLVDTHTGDSTPPQVSITSPAEGSVTSSRSVTVAWTGSDASGIKGYQHSLDGAAWSTQSTSKSVAFSNLADGQHQVQVRATDNYNNVATASVRFTVDASAPTISVTSPAAGSMVPSSVTISWSAQDGTSGVRAFKYRLDGAAWSADYAGTSRTFSGLSGGSHLVEVQAIDHAGNSATASVAFVVDAQPPAVQITSPSQGGYLGSSTVSVSYSATHSPSGPAYVLVRLDSGAWVNDTTKAGVTFQNVGDGAHTVTVRAYSSVGSVGESSVSFTVDTVAPSVTITTPGDGSMTGSGEVVVAWTGSDASGIGGYRYRVDGGAWSTLGPSTMTELALTDGSHLVEVQATDRAGNAATASATINVDTLLPMVSVDAPVGGSALNTTAVELRWTADGTGSDVARVEVRVDGTAWSDVDVLTRSYTLSGLGTGRHTVELRATDAAGHNATAASTFYIDVDAPGVVSHGPTGEDVAQYSLLTVTFSEPMDPASAVVTVEGVAGTIGWNGETLVFTPSEGLPRGQTIVVRGAAVDLAGNTVEFQWSFSTTMRAAARGQVQDDGGRPVEGAIVVLDNGDSTLTDGAGVFVFEVEAGVYNVTVSKDGFRSLQVPLELDPEETVVVGLSSVQPARVPSDPSGIYGVIVLVAVALCVALVVLMRKR